MANIVYFLGAGFSAPLELPVMSNFIYKAKDLFLSSHKYDSIFNKIKELSSIQTYFDADMLNIEEILSILTMQDVVSGNSSAQEFKEFIKDTIDLSTPQLKNTKKWREASIYNLMIEDIERWRPYVYFIANLLNIGFLKYEGDSAPYLYSMTNPENNYHIITVNYDLVIENIIKHFVEIQGDNSGMAHAKRITIDNALLSKLHGSADNSDSITPPTWNKNIGIDARQEWDKASKALQNATHIRFLGYSLPESDSYIRYFIKSSIINAAHIKSIDVICMDNSQNKIEKRYKEFIRFRDFRFLNRDIYEYFNFASDYHVSEFRKLRSDHFQDKFHYLEKAHEKYFKQNQS